MNDPQNRTYDQQGVPMTETNCMSPAKQPVDAGQGSSIAGTGDVATSDSLAGQRVTADTSTKTAATSKTTKRIVWLLLLAAVTLTLISMIKRFQKPVMPRSTNSVPTISHKPIITGDVAQRIQVHSDQASRRNLESLRLFELEIARVMMKHESKLSQAASSAAADTSSYGSCCEIIYLLACDQFNDTNNATNFLNEQINPKIEAALRNLNDDIKSELETLQYSLRRSTIQLAVDLAAATSTEATAEVELNPEDFAQADVNQALNNLGFNAIAISIGVGFDVVAILHSQAWRMMWSKLSGLAGRLFATQVTTVAASGGVALIDGPLPIGDILAVAGLLWTAWDIHASQQQFQQQLTVALDNKLIDARQEIHTRLLEHARKIVEEYRNLQDDIGTQAIAISVHERR